MHESHPGHKNEVPSISLVEEAYDEVLGHNKGRFRTSIVGMMRAVMAAEKAEAAGSSNFDENFQNNLSKQSERREMEADVQRLRNSDALADAGVQLVDDGSMTIISGPKDIAIGSGSLYPVVLGSSEEDANKFIDYVSELRPDDDIQLVVDVLKTTSETIWGGCKYLYSDDIADADKEKICYAIGKEVEKFIRIDQAADKINLAEFLPKRCEEFREAAVKRSGDPQTTLLEDDIELDRREDAVEIYQRLEKYVEYYVQNVLPEYLFLGDIDREGLRKSLLSIDAGSYRGNITKNETDDIVRVIKTNRSPEAVDYALRYAKEFKIGLENTLNELLKMPEADRPYYRIDGDETDRAYESVVRECLDTLRQLYQVRDKAEIDKRFKDIVAGLD